MCRSAAAYGLPVRFGARCCMQMCMRQVFVTEQWLPFPRPLVFAFFANPKNLPPLMPAWGRARIDRVIFCPPPPRPEGTPVFPGVVAGSGTRLTITARALPLIPLRSTWLALIEDFRWNEGFCDVQVKGPFAYWRHCHSVRDTVQEGIPGTVVRDEVSYELPLAPISRVGAPVGQFAIGAVFRYRQGRAAERVPRFAASMAS